jgi:hypothetical protein
LPDYRILGVVGRGGQGVVYEAVQLSTSRRCALKVLGLLSDERRRQRFEREVQFVAHLSHPGIVTLYDRGTSPAGRAYLAMEFVEGVPCTQAVTPTGGRADLDAALDLFSHILDAVRHAHQRGIIHRDLKPANILVDCQGRPHVLDFGLAKILDAPLERDLTRSGDFVGTRAYSAPEQLQDDPDLVDTRTDVYALGVILYELLTGRHPYRVQGSFSEVLRNITERDPSPPSVWYRRIGGELDTIVLTALAKESHRRYENAGAFRDDIIRYRTGRPIQAKGQSTWYLLRKIAARHRLAVALTVAFIVLLAGSSLWVVAAERRARASAAQLAARLAESEIERGRKLGPMLGSGLIWRHHLLSHPEERDVRTALLHVPPGTPHTYWALSELYRDSPCLATAQLHSGPVNALALAGEGLIRSVGTAGELREWDPARPASVRRLGAVGRSEAARFSAEGARVAVRHAGLGEVWDVPAGAGGATLPFRGRTP